MGHNDKNEWEKQLLNELRQEFKDLRNDFHDTVSDLRAAINETRIKQETSDAKIKIYLFLTNAIISTIISLFIGYLTKKN